MTYATKQDLIDRVGAEALVQLTDRSGAGDIDDEVIARALADADADINGYLAARATLPLAAPYPPLLVRLACTLAHYYLYVQPTEAVVTRYKAAVRTLEGLADGTVSLGLDGAGAGEVASDSGVTVVSEARVFTRETLKGF